MRCPICGGSQERRVTDFPFKVGDVTVVIVRSLPVLQCGQCGDAELENETMHRIDEVLAGVDSSSELEVIRFAG